MIIKTAVTLVSWQAVATVASGGADILIDVLLNGTSIFAGSPADIPSGSVAPVTGNTFGQLGAISTVALNAGGSGYAVNDYATITQGGSGNNAAVQVLTIGGGGAVATFRLVNAGTGYTVATGVATTTSGAGVGFTVDISAVTYGSIVNANPGDLLQGKIIQAGTGPAGQGVTLQLYAQ